LTILFLYFSYVAVIELSKAIYEDLALIHVASFFVPMHIVQMQQMVGTNFFHTAVMMKKCLGVNEYQPVSTWIYLMAQKLLFIWTSHTRKERLDAPKQWLKKSQKSLVR